VVANHPDSLRATVLCAFLPLRLLRFFAAQPSFTSSWKHSGFNLHAGEHVPPEAKADLEDLAQYILRNPFSVEKMTLESPTDMVIYRSRLNAKINRNFEVFTLTDFLAAITQHIPDKGAQMVRYYGWYSNKMRGVRQRGLPPELVLLRPGVSPPPPLKLPSKRWRDLILRVWRAAPFRTPHSSFRTALAPCGSSPSLMTRGWLRKFSGTSAPGMTRRPDRPRQRCRVPTPTNPVKTWTRPLTTKTS